MLGQVHCTRLTVIPTRLVRRQGKSENWQIILGNSVQYLQTSTVQFEKTLL